MTELPVVNGADCIRALQRSGFVVKRQKGSHVILKRDNPYARAVVPNHHQPLKPSTLRQIIRDAGMTVRNLLSYSPNDAPQPDVATLIYIHADAL